MPGGYFWMRTSENPQNANFVIMEFSEVSQEFIGNSSPPASVEGRSNPARVAREKEGQNGSKAID
jgi:hypothetical protein